MTTKNINFKYENVDTKDHKTHEKNVTKLSQKCKIQNSKIKIGQ